MIAPGDKFTIPVEIFATKENVGKVNVSIQTSGPISILNNEIKQLELNKIESQQVSFEAEVPMEIGEVHLEITASYSEGKVKSNTDIAVKPLSARISTSEMKVCGKGKTIKFDVPDTGIAGTNEVVLNISRLPKADLSKKIHWLIRYPYGCIEQTISAAFPQLYLREFLVSKNFSNELITDNINNGIKKLQKFQMPNGSFSYWPGNTEANFWGTNYAGHFMLAAREAGYHVPGEIFNNWVRFQQTEARNYKYSRSYYYSFREQLYRLYLLSMAGKPEIGAMNYLWENFLPKMDDTERWILAAAYKLAGIDNTANDIAMTTRVIVEDYKEMSGTFGSALRDKAMILDAMITLEKKEEALQLYLDLSDHISQDQWFSTQETGYTLLALGRYIKENYSQTGKDKIISGNIRLPDGSLEKIHSEDVVTSFDLSNFVGEEISFTSKSPLNDLFVTLNWSGIPIKLETEDSFQGLKIVNSWLDKNGNIIDPQNLTQGDIFEQIIQVTNLTDRNLENVALTQILPSGWEIENDRLEDNGSGKKRKNNVRNYNLDYTDIRDDRVMWFFNVHPDKTATFSIRLRAVSAGEFFLPATYCEVMYDSRFQARKAGMDVRVNSE